MAIKLLIKRQFKSGSLSPASQLLIRARYGAMGMKGYISSETLSDLNDPDKVVVSSMWHSIEDWQAWKNSPPRREIESEMEKLMEGPATVEAYALGMQQSIAT